MHYLSAVTPIFASLAQAGGDNFATSGHQSGASLLAGEYEQSEAGVVGYTVVAVVLIILGVVFGTIGAEPLGRGEWGAKPVVMVALAIGLGFAILALPLNPTVWLAVYYGLTCLVCGLQFTKGRLGLG